MNPIGTASRDLGRSDPARGCAWASGENLPSVRHLRSSLHHALAAGYVPGLESRHSASHVPGPLAGGADPLGRQADGGRTSLVRPCR